MKHIFVYAVISACLCIVATSCTNKEELVTYVEPGIYYVGMDISAIPDAVTRGIDSNNNFDTNYDPSVIYLHNKDTKNVIEIPVYDNCPDNEGGTCKGFRYRMAVDADGNATITPLNSDNQPYGTETLSLNSTATCYFSSLKEDVWKLEDDQVATNSLYGTSYTFYLRQKDVNKEIYRSKSKDDGTDLTINDLTVNGDLTIVRACAGFNVVGLFYDYDEMKTKPDGGTVTLTEAEFEEIMGSNPSTWYIKIYGGGDGFSNAYDLSSQESTGDQPGGYYSTGDAGHFEAGNIDMNQYIQFSDRYFGYSSHGINGYGYYTANRNHLFTPVAGEQPIEIYVLIKHWTGEGEPDAHWLLDDMGALQTSVNVTGGNPQPQNNCFYILGLLMDIKEFKAAWDANGGDNYSSSSTTRSLSGAPVREFKLENAKVICDVY